MENVPKISKEYVEPYGEGWLEDKKERQGFSSGQGYFGELILSSFSRTKSMRKFATIIPDLEKHSQRLESHLNKMTEAFKGVLVQLANRESERVVLEAVFGVENGGEPLADFFTRYFMASDDYLEEILKIVPNLEVSKKILKNKKLACFVGGRSAVTSITKGMVPSIENLIPILQYNQDWLDTVRAEVMPILEEERERVMKIVLKAIDEGRIPLDKTVAVERIQSAEIDIFDDLTAASEGKSGDFKVRSHLFRVSAKVAQDRKVLGSVFSHECAHALSGQTEVAYNFEEDSDDKFRDNLRVGLSPYGRSDLSGPSRSVSLEWLNEAVTEMINGEIFSAEHLVYRMERELLSKLIGSGIPKETFYNAYFENSVSTQPGTHKHPQFKKLFEETNERFGKGFLVKLSQFIGSRNEKNYIRNLGVVIALIEERGIENLISHLQQLQVE